MLDIRLIREEPELVKKNLSRRGNPEHGKLVDDVLCADKEWRKIKQAVDDLRHRKNVLSEEINTAKKQGKEVASLLREVKELPEKLQQSETKLLHTEHLIQDFLYRIPNLLDNSVPSGKDAHDNPVLRLVGKPKKARFTLQSHEQVAEELGVADFDAGRKVAGQGFNYLRGKLALLDLALQRYGIDFLIKKGFAVIIPPLMLNQQTLRGAVDVSAFSEVIYKIDGEDLYLIGTAEHTLVSMFRDKLLKAEELPVKVCAVTPCFRKEIGGHGVDTKGIFRMHQFNKVEQVIFSKPEDSPAMLEYMQKLTEEFFSSLKIPFRVIEICSGDLGAKFAKQYDIEAYFPRQQEYREVTSAGNCTDYQARRLNIKYEMEGERRYVHILNNTMVATSRAMVAILENYQQKDGSVSIPNVLWKYTKFKKIEKQQK